MAQGVGKGEILHNADPNWPFFYECLLSGQVIENESLSTRRDTGYCIDRGLDDPGVWWVRLDRYSSLRQRRRIRFPYLSRRYSHDRGIRKYFSENHASGANHGIVADYGVRRDRSMGA